MRLFRCVVVALNVFLVAWCVSVFHSGHYQHLSTIVISGLFNLVCVAVMLYILTDHTP